MIGIELEKPVRNGHDGSVGRHRYFKAKYKHGLFVKPNAIIEKQLPDNVRILLLFPRLVLITFCCFL